MKIKDLLYALTCLSFAIVIGGAVYEHLAVVPRWTQALPESLSMFQGQYGLYPQAFWIPVHPVTLALFAMALIASWKTARRGNLLVAFIGYAIVLGITFVYFVPELIELTSTSFGRSIDAGLTNRAKLWETLSLVRLSLLIVLSLILLLGLTKNGLAEDSK